MSDSNTNNKQKTYLIVGASSGIGETTAKLLDQEGHRLILTARREEMLQKLCSSLSENNLSFAFDASDQEACKSFGKTLKNEGIKIDGIVFSVGTHSVKPLRITKKADFEEMMESNLYSVTNVTSALLKRIEKGSSIVLIGSAATLRAGSAVSPYIAAKAALEGLARSWALELAPKNIRVNLLAPGVVYTDMTKHFFEQLTQEAVAEIERRHPLGIGQPEDVSNAVSFLLNEKSKWMTGQTIVIDGGFSISDH